jgi:hypothetical protein
MFPCFRVLIILYMNPWKSQVAQATLIHVCMENILHPKKCSLPDTLPALQRRRPDLPGAACLVSGANRCSVPSARACVVPCMVCPGTCPALVLARPALLSRSGCAGGWGLHLWGIWGEPWVGWSTPRVEKIQKRRFSGLVPPTPTPPSQNETYLIVQVSKFSEKYKKTPFGA